MIGHHLIMLNHDPPLGSPTLIFRIGSPFKSGAGSRIRTDNRQVGNLLLYQLNYTRKKKLERTVRLELTSFGWKPKVIILYTMSAICLCLLRRDRSMLKVYYTVKYNIPFVFSLFYSIFKDRLCMNTKKA